MSPSDHATICVQPLAVSDTFSILDLFQHFAHQPWAMLLDSADSQHPDSRFDIMVAQPVATLVTRGQITDITHNKQQSQSQSHHNPIDLLSQWQQLLFPQSNSTQTNELTSVLPFSCGALGYFSYDLGRRFEQLPNMAEFDTQSPDMAVGLYSWAVIKDNLSNKTYLSWHKDYEAPTSKALLSLLSTGVADTSFSLKGAWQANMDKGAYVQKISAIHEYLKAGDCYQVNLAQRFSNQYQGDEWLAYKHLRHANQAPFSAFIRLPDSCVLSISPERFLSCQQDRVQTKPIKGTKARHTEAKMDQLRAQELQASAKDRAENLMIVDLLRNDLSKSCRPGSVKVPELFAIESFPAVHHLVSTVEGQLAEGKNSLELLQGAFPGGSITGAPKIRAMEIIEELEPHRRNVYCGSIGYVNFNQNMDTSICIRTLLCENKQIHCWAGGGIVMDSNADAEYQETLDKVAKILPQLLELNE